MLDEAALDAWIERLGGAADAIAFDTETTSLDYMQADLVGVSFAVEPGHAAYVPFGHDYRRRPGAARRARWCSGGCDRSSSRSSPAKIGQNLKYDMSVLARMHGIDARRACEFDTMLESYVLDSTATRHDMDSLALKYLGHRTIHFEDIAGKGAKQLTFNQIPVEDAGPYAAEDADVTLRLHRVLRPRLEEHATLATLCDTVEIPLVPVLSRIERNGVRIDVRRLNQQSAELAGIGCSELQASAHDLRRRAVQPRVVQADPGNPVRPARPAGARQDPQGPAVDRGVGVAGARLRSRAAQSSSSSTGAMSQAQVDLHRRPAGVREPRHRTGPHQLPPGGGLHRAPVLVGPESAEHPGAHP